MAFDLSLHGKEIIISHSAQGRYVDFDAIKKDILLKDKLLVIDNIMVASEGIKYPVPDGLAKIKADIEWADFFTEEIITNGRKEHENEISQKRIADEEEKKVLASKLDNAKKTGNWKDIPPELKDKASANVVLTTSYLIAGKEIDFELDVITYECAYGMNVFRDLFASVRDIVGGRSKAVETVIRDARITAMQGLREEALNIGADAVIAVDLDYLELSGGGKNGMLLTIATGTAVKLK